MLLGLARVARGVRAKLNTPGKFKMASNQDGKVRSTPPLCLFPVAGAAGLKKLLVPCRRRTRRFAGHLEASPPVADDALTTAGHVADLQPRRKHGEFEKRVLRTMFLIGRAGKNDCVGQRAGRNENPKLEKPPEDSSRSMLQIARVVTRRRLDGVIDYAAAIRICRLKIDSAFLSAFLALDLK